MLSHRIVKIADLSSVDIDAMYRLMHEYYEGTSHVSFIRDLHSKKGVLLVVDNNGDICGFTTYDLYPTEFQNETIHVLYSGDTVIRKEYWGHLQTSKMFMSLLVKCLNENGGRIFWYLITKGIRTYRLLPLFFRHYYPTYKYRTPEFEARLLEQLTTLQFEHQLSKGEGVIRFQENGDCLKYQFCQIDESKMTNPHIQYFLKVNPGYMRGDNLPCIAEISINNFTDRALKYMSSLDAEVYG